MQQVNLYQKELRPAQVAFSARTVLGLAGIWLLLLATNLGIGGWRQHRAAVELTAAQAAATREAQQLAQLEARYPPPAKDPALARESARLQAARDGRALLLTQLEGKSLGNTDGFSPQLTALARQTMTGLWLTHIDLRQGGKELTLEGGAGNATTVPLYLQRLAGEQAFAGMEFDTFRLSRPPKAPRQIDFFLETSENGSAQAH